MTIKFQISSTKLQINLKLQYTMTKTFPTVASHRKPWSAGDDAIGHNSRSIICAEPCRTVLLI